MTIRLNNNPLTIGLEISDLTQAAMCNRLTDVDQSFKIHLIQSLL
jgi:hypothetical protein